MKTYQYLIARSDGTTIYVISCDQEEQYTADYITLQTQTGQTVMVKRRDVICCTKDEIKEPLQVKITADSYIQHDAYMRTVECCATCRSVEMHDDGEYKCSIRYVGEDKYYVRPGSICDYYG